MPDAVLDALSVAQREGNWRKLLLRDSRASFTYVAEREGEAVGFCSVAAPSRDDDAGEGTCEVTAVYVEPNVWRAGVGAALLDTALTELRHEGWDEVTLWVLAGNHGAREFYERSGFAPDGGEMQHERSGRTEIRLRASLSARGAALRADARRGLNL